MDADLAHYVMRGGSRGRERLRVLARVMAPTTLELFDRLGVTAGWRCLDVGCGGGDVTTELARIVEPAVVVGIDVDEEQLEIARREAAGLGNVVFRVREAARIDEHAVGSFDLVYARFLLTHLPDPEVALATMIAEAAPGGIVCVEDIDIDGHFCAPPSSAFENYVEWYDIAHRQRGGDPTIGRRLPSMLRWAGLTGVNMNVVHPAGMTGDITRIAPQTIAVTRDAIVGGGIATEDGFDRTAAELEAFCADPDTVVSMPRVVQAWATVPALR